MNSVQESHLEQMAVELHIQYIAPLGPLKDEQLFYTLYIPLISQKGNRHLVNTVTIIYGPLE